MFNYYDKSGNPINMKEWIELKSNKKYHRVGKTILPNGNWISTVWLGLDHSYTDEGSILIFETMVFPPDSFIELDMERYTTEQEAIQGHKNMVEKWSNPDRVDSEE